MYAFEPKETVSLQEADQDTSELANSWQELARCRGRNSAVFYPQRGVPTASARALCKECAVKEECLHYALENDERFGIWGGLSERERRKLQRERFRRNSVDEDPSSWL